jgi:membrane-associated phospholipid phosphatase
MILNWGIEVVVWCQRFSPALDAPFKVLTFLGDETFYLLFMPLVYWCIDRRMGARLFFLLLFSAYINESAKALANQPRPFAYDPRVKPITHAVGGGFPSGHTQHAVVIWGYLAARLGNTMCWLMAGLLMLGIPLSRVYLGVHFPTDLLGGYLLGGLILVAFLRLSPLMDIRLSKMGFVQQLAAAVTGPLLFMLVNPTGSQNVLSMASLLLGTCCGFVLERQFVGLSCKGIWWKKSIGYVLGVAILFGLWAGLKVVFTDLEPVGVFRFIRYAVVGLWGSVGAPWLLVRLKLAPVE